MSDWAPFASGPGTRSVAIEANTAVLPSALSAGSPLRAFGCPPDTLRLTRRIVLAVRSRRMMSTVMREPSGAATAVSKTMNLPSPLIRGFVQSLAIGRSSTPTLSSVALAVVRSIT
jgi:hypothetical protein